MSSWTDASPQAAAQVFFPQTFSHDTHYMNARGDLYTALITGGDRLLLMKNGVVLAQSGPLLLGGGGLAPTTATPSSAHVGTTARPSAFSCVRESRAAAAQSSPSLISSDVSSRPQPRVCAVSLCRFTDDALRVAVATTADLFVFEWDDSEELWRDTQPSSFWCTTADEDTVATEMASSTPMTVPPPRSMGGAVTPQSAGHRGGSPFGAPYASPLGCSNAVPLRGHSISSGTRAPPQPCGVTGRLRWRRVAFPPSTSAASHATPRGPGRAVAPPRKTASYDAASVAHSDSTAGTGVPRSSGSGAFVPIRVHASLHFPAVRAMDFVSAHSLCLVLDGEAVLIALGNDRNSSSRASVGGSATGNMGGRATPRPQVDCVVWRSMGAYRDLAVCRVNHHVALTLGRSTVVVFPSRMISGITDGSVSSSSPRDAEGRHFSIAASTASSFFATNSSSEVGTRAMAGGAYPGGDSCSSSPALSPAFSPTSQPTIATAFPCIANVANAAAPRVAVAEDKQQWVTLVERGLSTSTGIYHITSMHWHRVSSHTLLCVTCARPQEETAYLMLFTVQSLSSTRRYTNVMEEHDDGSWGLCRGGYEGEEVGGASLSGGCVEDIVQLVPAGVIALTYTPAFPPTAGLSPSWRARGKTAASASTATAVNETPVSDAGGPCSSRTFPTSTATPGSAELPPAAAADADTTWGGSLPPAVSEMHTSLVPNFSRSAHANSISSRMEFLHVEGDGTVRTSSYSFGRQKHASFAKQRAVGMACTKLLQPLLHLYGSLVSVTVLPAWHTRPMELGHDTEKQPCAVEVLLNASRRYRMVLRFTSDVLMAVMVDLSAAVYRVEAFLTLGSSPLLSLRAVSSQPEVEAARRITCAPTRRGDGTRSPSLSARLFAGLLGYPKRRLPPPGGAPQRHSEAVIPSSLEAGETDSSGRVATPSQRKAKRENADTPLRPAPPVAAATVGASANEAVAPDAPPRVVWGVCLIQVEPNSMHARVLTIAPLSEECIPGFSHASPTVSYPQGTSGAKLNEKTPHDDVVSATRLPLYEGSHAAEMPTTVLFTDSACDENAAATTAEKDVAAFMARKCPEKLKLLPALLKATQQDAGRLLTQLTAKYGPLENEEADTATCLKCDGAGLDRRGGALDLSHRAPQHPLSMEIATSMISSPLRPAAAPSILISGWVTGDGDVLLLLRAGTALSFDSKDDAGAARLVDEDDRGDNGAAAAIVWLRPQGLESLAPVHRIVRTGFCHIPFVPATAAYVAIPEDTQRRWWLAQPQPTPFASPGTLTDPSSPYHPVISELGLRTAFCTGQQLCRAAAEAAVVRWDVFTGPTGSAQIQVHRSFLQDDVSSVRATQSRFSLPAEVRVSDVVSVAGVVLVNNDVVVGVLCQDRRLAGTAALSTSTTAPPLGCPSGERSSASVLYLYGFPAVQSLSDATSHGTDSGSAKEDARGASYASGPSSFSLEAVFPDVHVFYLGTSGEVVLLRHPAADGGGGAAARVAAGHREAHFERWLRCFPNEGGTSDDTGEGNGYFYIQDDTWRPPCHDSSHMKEALPEGQHCSIGATDAIAVMATVNLADEEEFDWAGTSEEQVAVSCCSRPATTTTTTTCPVLYAMSDCSYIHLRQLPLRRRRRLSMGAEITVAGAAAIAATGLPPYHPDAIMQLIGMARWTALEKVLTSVADAVRAALSPSATGPAPDATAEDEMLFQAAQSVLRGVSVSSAARGFRDCARAAPLEVVLPCVTPARMPASAFQETDPGAPAAVVPPSTPSGNGGQGNTRSTTSVSPRLYDISAHCDASLQELAELLPQVTLGGLQGQEQLALLCILEALRDTLPLSRSVDEAAARHLFYSRYMGLRRRLRLPLTDATAATASDTTTTTIGIPAHSILFFEVGRTAARAVGTASFFWAAMSDSQSTLVSLLFDRACSTYIDGGAGGACGVTVSPSTTETSTAPSQELSWEQVEQSGVAFWLRSTADLRAIAEKVGRHQYRTAKELTACALMYCTARKVGTLAALAKAQNNPRLHAFFSRDFAHDEHHRAAAAANAYAAMSKNLPQYAAAFFLLAGDVRSAVQVLLQRCRSPSLALFVLRAAGEEVADGAGASAVSRTASLLEWYIAQRKTEEESCGTLDLWELTCLRWLDAAPLTAPEMTVRRRIEALQCMAAHRTAHPEVLCALRYARDCVPALAYRGEAFLSPPHEVICLLRLARFCMAHRLSLNGYLHYHEADFLLRRLQAAAAAVPHAQLSVRGGDAELPAAGCGNGAARVPCAALRPFAPPPAPIITADFDTGTLVFRGFDSDDEEANPIIPVEQVLDRTSGGEGKASLSQDACSAPTEHQGPLPRPFRLSSASVAMVEAEVRYAYTQFGVGPSPPSSSRTVVSEDPVERFSEGAILRCALLSLTATSLVAPMASSGVAGDALRSGVCMAEVRSGAKGWAPPAWIPSRSAAPSSSVRDVFATLLDILMQAHKDAAKDAQPQGREMQRKAEVSTLACSPAAHTRSKEVATEAMRAPADGALRSAPTCPITGMDEEEEGWCRVCAPMLHFVLSKTALAGANYVMLLALLRMPVSTDEVLVAAAQAGLQGMARTAKAPQRASGTAMSPLHQVALAFIGLLGLYMRDIEGETCHVDEQRLGRDTAARRPSARGGEGLMKGRVWGFAAAATASSANIDAKTDEDDSALRDSSGASDVDAVHQSIFDALLAAAAAAAEEEEVVSVAMDGRAAASPGASCAAGMGWSSRHRHGDGSNGSSPAVTSGDAVPFHMNYPAQVALLLSCCQAQLQLRLAEHLRKLIQTEFDRDATTPTTQRAIDAGILYSDPLPMSVHVSLHQRRLLLCALMLDVTLQWSALSEVCMARLYTAQPQHAPGPLTDPNGIFLEVRQVITLIRAVLWATIGAPPCAATTTVSLPHSSSDAVLASVRESPVGQRHSTCTPPPLPLQEDSTLCAATWLKDNTLMMMELCTTQLEVFWTLPSLGLAQCRPLSITTRAALGLLRQSTSRHPLAAELLQRMMCPVETTADESCGRCFTSAANEVARHNRSTNLPSWSRFPFSLRTASPPPPLCAGSPLQTQIPQHLPPPLSTSSSSSPPPPPTPPPPSFTPDDTMCPALAYLHLAWMRRHHTHALLRSLLLTETLNRGRPCRGSDNRLFRIDRLILTQHPHAVTGIRFDASSCDSVVWTTEAGTGVGHGFRELLAGDNEEALWSQTTERNLATAAFTLGLTAQQEQLRLAKEHAAAASSSSSPLSPSMSAVLRLASALERRPHCAMAANGMPSSHPHLPFFLSRHRDGHLDLYPFASQECLASFSCVGRRRTAVEGRGDSGGEREERAMLSPRHGASLPPLASWPGATLGSEPYPVTPACFSPNGYLIAVGLSDGSVAGWRFAASAVDGAPAFVFPRLFEPFGICACVFCGDRSSVLVVVGVTKEPHGYERGNRRVEVGAEELVGEVLLLDTTLDAGAVTVRCALPFIPAYAVYLTSLRAVLVVSKEGLLASYAVVTGSLAMLGTVPVTTVLRSRRGLSLGAECGGASATVSPTTRTVAATPDVYVTCVARSTYDPLVALGTSHGLVLLLHVREIAAAIVAAQRRIQHLGESPYVYYSPSASTGDGENRSCGKRGGTAKHRSATRASQIGRSAPLSSWASAEGNHAEDVRAPASGSAYVAQLPEETVLSEATCMQVAPLLHPRSAIEDLVFSPSMLLAGLRDGKAMAISLIPHAMRKELTAGAFISSVK